MKILQEKFPTDYGAFCFFKGMTHSLYLRIQCFLPCLISGVCISQKIQKAYQNLLNMNLVKQQSKLVKQIIIVFQMLNIISTTDNYNSELFYTDIDPDKFKLCLIDNQKESSNNKTLTDLAENISKDIKI